MIRSSLHKWMSGSVIALVSAWATTITIHAAVTLVDNDYLSSNNGTSTIQLTMNNVAVNDVITVCGMHYQNAATVVFSDDDTNTYATVFGATTFNQEAVMSYATATGTGNVVLTMNIGANNYKGFHAQVWRGLNTASLEDDKDFQDQASTTAPTTPSMTSSGVGVAVGCFHGATGAFTITPGTGYTQLNEDETFTNVMGASAYQLTTAGSYAVNWTVGTASSTNTVGLILKAAVSSVTAPRGLLLGVWD